jgi:hypothetical protein
MDTQIYLKELEKEFGENKSKNITKPLKYSTEGIFTDENLKTEYKWTLKDRLKRVYSCIRERYDFLKNYNPLDFKTYEEEYNPYGFDVYAKIYKTSTPLIRFKNFWGELQTTFKLIVKAFFYVPFIIKYFQKNKDRISWFEKNIPNLFETPLKSKIKEDLKNKGYVVEKYENVDYVFKKH